MDLQVIPDRKGLLGHKVHKEILDHRVLLDLKEILVHKQPLVLQVRRVQLDLQVPQDRKGQLDQVGPPMRLPRSVPMAHPW